MAIVLKDIHFHYPKQPKAAILTITSWHIEQGQHLLLHGPSGAGKSTLLNLICGLIVPISGEVRVLGEPLNEMTSSQRDRFRAENIGYVFQQFNLIPYLNAIDNIQLSSRFSRLKVTHTNPVAEMLEMADQLSLDKVHLKKPVRELSIGQQQRIAIARALINKPKLLIADEPTSSLDPINRDKFMALLMPMVKRYNMTLLVVSHDQGLSQYFERVESFTNINRPVVAK